MTDSFLHLLAEQLNAAYHTGTANQISAILLTARIHGYTERMLWEIIGKSRNDSQVTR